MTLSTSASGAPAMYFSWTYSLTCAFVLAESLVDLSIEMGIDTRT